MGLTVAYTQPTDSLSFSPQGVWDTVYDHLGNSYRLQDIRVSNTSQPSGANQKVTSLISCTTNTYFEFYFEDDCGMELNTPLHIQRRSVLCRLAEDLSLFIQRPIGSTAPVRIWVRDITQLPGFNNNVLGLATGFYITPSGGVGSSILDNQVYKTIVSGVDAYTAVATPLASSNTSGQGNLFYHGMMAFNFNIDPATNLPIYDWNTNLGVAPTASQFDLYSVMLHEMTHALGFASLIDINGVSVLGAGAGNYSRYDLFLRNQANTQPLIVVSGALIVDIPQLAIDYCTLIFAAGAEMRVLANQGVIIKNSTLRGCTNMWRGIILDPSATNNITTFANISNSIVQDAEIGIRMQEFTKTGIHATAFSKCHTGVFAPFATNVVTVSQSAFNGQGGAYLPTFTGQTLVPFSNRGFAGLHLQNNPNVFFSSIGTTTFRDMYYGIRAINSNCFVNKCNFQNIQPYAGYTGTAGGAGIYAQSSSNVGNFTAGIKDCNFTTCWYGIYATGIGTDIKNNTMTNIGNINNASSGNSAGIHIQSAGGFDHTISNNNISSKMSGIRLLLVAQPSTRNTRINDNIITLNAPANFAGGMGIELIHPASPASYRARIYQNTINIANANHGIYLSSIQGVRLNQNTITHTGNNFPFTSASGRKGILLSGCSIDTISCNTIQSNTLYQNVNHEGIAIGNSTNIRVLGNTMNRTYRGMSYNGTLTGMEIVDNDVQTHFHGWYIGGTMNTQGSANPPIDNGNTWTGPFVGVGARAVFKTTFPVAAYSVSPPPVNLLTPIGIVQPLPLATPLTYNCIIPMMLPTTMGNEWAIGYAHEVAAGTLTFAEYETETRFALQMELYRRMSADSLLYAGDSILQAFFVQQQADNIGDIYEIEQGELSRTVLPSPLIAAIEVVETQIRDLQVLIENNLNLLDTISNDSSQVLLLNQITSLKAQIQTHENTYETLQMQAEDIDSVRVMQILYHNQGIVAQELYEANMSTVNMLYYEKVNRNIVLTETEMQSIWNIASQCPSAGGNAVFQARGVLSLLGYSPDFDDYDLCTVVQSPWRVGEVDNDVENVSIYPNPTEGEVNIQFGKEYIAQNYTLYNAMGQKVIKGILSEKQSQTIYMSGYLSGIYLLQVGGKIFKIILQ